MPIESRAVSWGRRYFWTEPFPIRKALWCRRSGFPADSVLADRPLSWLWESFAALGITRFIGLGTAGGLLERDELSLEEGERSVKAGDILLADRAIRDEGTSYHYLEEGEEAVPSSGESRRLEGLLKENGITYRKGALWTTDAFFRETEEEVSTFLKEGALAVDMEAASLYACARKRGLSAASLFVISDILTQDGWVPEFHRTNIMESLRQLFKLSAGGFLIPVSPFPSAGLSARDPVPLSGFSPARGGPYPLMPPWPA